VDEEDVHNMTAVEVSPLISQKSLQQATKLTVLRSERRNEFGIRYVRVVGKNKFMF
jgi:hypothetical protein